MKINGITAQAAILCALLGGCGSSAATTTKTTDTTSAKTEAPTTDSLDAALAGGHRSEANRARDAYRHPKETLAFFGLTADMRVVELWPGAGWYTELLAPVLRQRGELIAVTPKGDYDTKYRTFLTTHPELYDRVKVVTANPPTDVKFGEPDSADLVLTFRNAHNWISGGVAEDVFKAAFAVLRPGGVFGVVDHRANEGAKETDGKSGYVTESQIISLAKAAGFEFVDKSEINANPKDTKDYPAGVWSLPPVLRLGDQDRAKYQAIGESDRMTLKFRKPGVDKHAELTTKKSVPAQEPTASAKDNPPNK